LGSRRRRLVARRVTATVALVNRTASPLPMVMLDLLIPAGFEVDSDGFRQLLSAGTIGKYQITPRQVLVYLTAVESNASSKFSYRLRATMPVQATIPPATAYEYYDPAIRTVSASAQVNVKNKL
jgi:uncharacterized protein YfaS (alpha-2-macroglobulin family)